MLFLTLNFAIVHPVCDTLVAERSLTHMGIPTAEGAELSMFDRSGRGLRFHSMATFRDNNGLISSKADSSGLKNSHRCRRPVLWAHALLLVKYAHALLLFSVSILSQDMIGLFNSRRLSHFCMG